LGYLSGLGSHHRSFLSFQIDNLQVAGLQSLPAETDEMGLKLENLGTAKVIKILKRKPWGRLLNTLGFPASKSIHFVERIKGPPIVKRSKVPSRRWAPRNPHESVLLVDQEPDPAKALRGRSRCDFEQIDIIITYTIGIT